MFTFYEETFLLHFYLLFKSNPTNENTIIACYVSDLGNCHYFQIKPLKFLHQLMHNICSTWFSLIILFWKVNSARIIWKTRSVKAKRLLLYYLMVYTTLISMFLYTQNFENNTCERGCLLTLELALVLRHHGSPQPTESSLSVTVFVLRSRVLRRCCCSPISYILHTPLYECVCLIFYFLNAYANRQYSISVTVSFRIFPHPFVL